MKIQIISVGEPKKFYYKEAIDEYTKRLGKFAVTVHAVKDNKHAYEKVSSIIQGSFTVALDEQGKQLASRQLAHFISEKELDSIGCMSLVVGPADGHPKDFTVQADFVLSLSKLTMPHELALLFACEAIYRAQSIRNNHPYHRD